MKQGEKSLAVARARRVSQRANDLLRSRANLSHLIYSMEHDRSLGAAESKIDALRRLLSGIEHQIVARFHSGHPAHP